MEDVLTIEEMTRLANQCKRDIAEELINSDWADTLSIGQAKAFAHAAREIVFKHALAIKRSK